MTVHVLSIHADWRCGRSGACCSSGWPLPIEHRAEARLRALLARGAIDLGATVGGRAASTARLLPALADPDDEHGARLGQDDRGRCLFLEAARDDAPAACAVQRQHGPAALPAACRLFPRVALLEPRGASLTLSHWCPTVAAQLLREDVPVEIARDPQAFPDDGGYEGLDARAALPPLLRPDALFGWESHAAWERHAVATLARADLAPEQALDRLAAQAEVVRAWRAADGPLDAWVEAALLAPGEAAPGTLRRLHGLADGSAGDLALFARALDAVPAPARALLRGIDDLPREPAALAEIDARCVAPGWTAVARPVRAYLASKAFAAWAAHQGRGVRTRVLALAVALAVLRVQAARLAARAGRTLDPALLVDAARAADLLLLHLASREDLHASLAACEEDRRP
jgi:hypothetical protein